MPVVENVVKQYGDIVAVGGVSFEAGKGHVFGLLGPNGAGKWGSRMVLATNQVGAALVVGTFLFRMNWGPDIGMVVIVLAAWATFCASAGLLLGSIARTEAQASGLGVLAAPTRLPHSVDAGGRLR